MSQQPPYHRKRAKAIAIARQAQAQNTVLQAIVAAALAAGLLLLVLQLS